MSKRDYEAVAEILGKNLASADGPAAFDAVWQVGLDLARLFAGDNARFDRDRFLRRVHQVRIAEAV